MQITHPKMKNKSLVILTLLTTLAIFTTVTCKAQTNLISGTNTYQQIVGTGTTIAGWFSSENPANRYQDVLFWSGAINQNNATVANETGGSWDLWRQNAGYYPYTGSNTVDSTLFAAVETRTRMAGIGGTLLSQGVGPEFGWMQNDIRLGVFVEPVYRFSVAGSPSTAKTRAEFGLFGDKMVSQNAAVGLMISFQTGERYPFIGGDMSISFGNGKGFLGLF